MSPAYNERHHHHGCILFLFSIGFLIVVASFGYTYFTCYDAEKNMFHHREVLLVECGLLCDTVPKFSVLATKYDMALFHTSNKAKIARKNFYLKRSISEKADAYYTLEDSLSAIADKLKNNHLAVRDVRWDDVTKDLRNITKRVTVAQTNYTAAANTYNATLTGEMRKMWLKVLDFKPAEQFEKPAHLIKQPENTAK